MQRAHHLVLCGEVWIFVLGKLRFYQPSSLGEALRGLGMVRVSIARAHAREKRILANALQAKMLLAWMIVLMTHPRKFKFLPAYLSHLGLCRSRGRLRYLRALGRDSAEPLVVPL